MHPAGRSLDTATPLLRRINVPFLGSLAIIVGAYVVAISMLRLVIVDTDVAATLSAMVIGAGPRVQRELEQRVPRSRVALVSYDGYSIRWWVLVVGGAVAIWLAESARILIEVRGGPAMAVSASARDALALLPVAAAFGVGILSGARSNRWPFLVASLAIVSGHLVGITTSDTVVSIATDRGTAGVVCQPGVPGSGASAPLYGSSEVDGAPCTDAPPDPIDALFGPGLAGQLLADELPILVLSGMVAMWWGSRTRSAFYLGHVAGMLDDADRAALMALAEDEGRRRHG